VTRTRTKQIESEDGEMIRCDACGSEDKTFVNLFLHTSDILSEPDGDLVNAHTSSREADDIPAALWRLDLPK